jgi:hypothetical protein
MSVVRPVISSSPESTDAEDTYAFKDAPLYQSARTLGRNRSKREMTFRPTLRHTLEEFQAHVLNCSHCESIILGRGEPCKKGRDIIGSLRLEYSGPIKPLSVSGR